MPMSANPAGNAFCGKCGKPFVSVCLKCGAKLADGQRFCGVCGTVNFSCIRPTPCAKNI